MQLESFCLKTPQKRIGCHNLDHCHSDPTTPSKDSLEEKLLNMFLALTLMGEDLQGESRAVTKMCWKCAGTRMPKGCVRKGFVGMRIRRTPPRNSHSPLSGTHTDREAQHKATALCFSPAAELELPTPLPAGVASLKRKVCYVLSQDTRLWGFTATFRFVLVLTFVSFWWDGRKSVTARHRRCGKKKNASDTQKGNASTVRKVLPALLPQECA